MAGSKNTAKTTAPIIVIVGFIPKYNHKSELLQPLKQQLDNQQKTQFRLYNIP